MDDTTIGQNSFRSAPTVMVRRPDNDRLHHQHQDKEKKSYNTLQSKKIDNEEEVDDGEEDRIDLDGSIGDFVISTTKNNKKYGGAGGIDSSMHSLLTEASSLSSSNNLSTAAHHPYCSTSREYTPYESEEIFVTAIKEKIYANTKTMLSPRQHSITNDTYELHRKIKRSDTTLTRNGENSYHRPTAMLPLQPETSSHRHRNSTTSTIGSSSRSNHKCSIRAYNRPDAWIGGRESSSNKPPKRSWKVKKIVNVTKHNSSIPNLISESLHSCMNDASTISSSSII